MQLGVFHQPQAEVTSSGQRFQFSFFVKATTQIPCSRVVSLTLLSTKIFRGNALKGKMGVRFQLPLAPPDQHSLTQAQQWRTEAALGKAGKLSRPSQRYLLSGICWRSSVTATNLRYFWTLQKKTDCIKRDSTFESANMKHKSWRGSCWTTFVIISLPSLPLPSLSTVSSRAEAREEP